MPSDIRTHAMDRAKERYGIDLTFADVIGMSRRCAAGEGLTETLQDGVQYHTLIFGERVLWLVYKPGHLDGRGRDGTIITVMPSHVAMVRVKRDVAHMHRRTGRYDKLRRRR